MGGMLSRAFQRCFCQQKKISYAVYSDCGSRAVNEDAARVFHNDGRYCFVLCDGLGGHGMGDVASNIVAEKVGECFNDANELIGFGGKALEIAQNVLVDEQKRLNAVEKMKTTAVILALDGQSAEMTFIGDSRVYCFRRNKVSIRSLDHSIPQMLVLAGDLKESEIRNHPDRNLVLRVMGTEWEEPQFETMQAIPLRKAQAFLLCSDGFWELIEEKEMCGLLKKSNSVDEWLESMKDLVVKKGEEREMDNHSAIAIWCS